MTRRGRPPHPDILTPRQWEVLDLLRRNYTDQQIAEALDVTLAGAKYHVSEILTKLGVSSREEAAAWEPGATRQPLWKRALALSLAIKALGVAIVLTAVVGLGILAWGVANGGSGDDAATKPMAVFPQISLPDPLTPPTLSREQAILHAGTYGDIRAIDAQASTMDGILALDEGSAPGVHRGTSWLVRYRTFADVGFNGGTFGGQASPVIACRAATTFFLEPGQPDDGGPVGGSGLTGDGLLPDSECVVAMTSDVAIVVAARELNQIGEPDRVTAAQLSFDDALEKMRETVGSPAVATGNDVSGSDLVWLVAMYGNINGAPNPTPVPTTPPATPFATRVPVCRVAMAAVSQDRIVIASGSAPANDC